jgi:oxygen-dependent protoporphyrinogen oxidase
LISGIFAGDAGELTAGAAFPSLKEMDTRYGSLVLGAIRSRRGKPRPAVKPPRGLLSFRQGLSTLPRAIGGGLGSRLKLQTPVRKIQKTASGWKQREMPCGGFEAQRLVAIPSDAASRPRGRRGAGAAALAGVPSPALAVLHPCLGPDAFELPPDGLAIWCPRRCAGFDVSDREPV